MSQVSHIYLIMWSWDKSQVARFRMNYNWRPKIVILTKNYWNIGTLAHLKMAGICGEVPGSHYMMSKRLILECYCLFASLRLGSKFCHKGSAKYRQLQIKKLASSLCEVVTFSNQKKDLIFIIRDEKEIRNFRTSQYSRKVLTYAVWMTFRCQVNCTNKRTTPLRGDPANVVIAGTSERLWVRWTECGQPMAIM